MRFADFRAVVLRAGDLRVALLRDEVVVFREAVVFRVGDLRVLVFRPLLARFAVPVRRAGPEARAAALRPVALRPAALRLRSPSASMFSFLSVAFSSLRLELRRPTTLS